MHLPPEVWGPIFWATFHLVSMAYPETPTYAEKRAAKEFFNSMVHLLPCPVCRDHFREILTAMPVDSWLDDRKSLVEWVWTLHNRVNLRLGKPEITQAEFMERYKEMAERGLPIPPSNPTAELSDSAIRAAQIQGGMVTVGGLIAIGVVGSLLWLSYSGKK
jgi:hypothetical protein